MMRSLSQRLFLSAVVVLGLFLVAAGLILEHFFTVSMENIVREQLQGHTYALMSIADNNGGSIALPEKLPEQRFNSDSDALIAIVTDSQQVESWRSLSAAGKRFNLPPPAEGEWLFGRAVDSNANAYYISSYSALWPDEFGQNKVFVFTIMETTENYRSALGNYQLVIAASMTVIALVLLALQTIILRWGLGTVRSVAVDVAAMNAGESNSLSGAYPRELQPLINNVNNLISNERRQRERYRTRMADLSHSLKTPLSVLRGIAGDTDNGGAAISRDQILNTLARQVDRMDLTVNHQLQSAVASEQAVSFIAQPLAQEVATIIAALGKVYHDKPIAVEVGIAPSLSFFGDENDLAEILGNLLDNAYKYAYRRVKVSAAKKISDVHTQLWLQVEDDGPGVPSAERSSILRRGVRLDSNAEGQGIGLAMVREIIASYQGSIEIGESTLGGALFKLTVASK